MIFGGLAGPSMNLAGGQSSEEYNGSSWSDGGNMSGISNCPGQSFGTQTAAIGCGGDPDGSFTESWNGSSWTEVNNLNTGRGGIGGFGTNTDALAFGGGTPTASAKTEHYNGTSWSEVADLSTGRYKMGGSGTGSLALVFAGYDPGNSITTATEEWNMSASVETIAFD